MKNKLLLLILFFEIITYLIIKPEFNSKYEYTKIESNNNINIDSVYLENYVIGVVAAEMPASFSFEALKAQAVAARTFIYNKIINSNASYQDIYNDKGQSYITKKDMKEKWGEDYEKYYDKVSKAVLDTKGEVIYHNDKVIVPYYFSTSNGKTEDSSKVFGEKDYLVSVDSSWDKNEKDYEYIIKMNIDEFKTKLGISDKLVVINKIVRNETNHIDLIIINNKQLTGIEVRKKLGLRSTDFDINIENNNVEIKTRGYGHGVGMSQTGANYLAKTGKNYIDILKYYYKDVTISKI